MIINIVNHNSIMVDNGNQLVASWESRELQGGFNGKFIKLNGPFSIATLIYQS
jgi:hypothetical protein